MSVGVVGAGAMGAGIAQVAASAGHAVVLSDARDDAVTRGREQIRSALDRLVEKGRLTADQAAATLARVRFASPDAPGRFDPAVYRDCALVIEAVVEDIGIKRETFARLEQVVAPTAILATNTSSLSVAGISSALTRPERFVGLHFFNPAPIMALVEVVPGVRTRGGLAAELVERMRAWGKVPVVAADSPGFIVNRVARPFYGEAMRIVEEGLADPATVDWAMRTLGGFRMGPCELMDFIGHDVNFAVTRSVFEQTFHEVRYRPALRQQRMVEAGWLGKKSGRGFFDYAADAVAPAPHEDAALGEVVFHRVLAMLVNEACDAVQHGVASAADVELAMTKGVNYPKGLLAWGDEVGPTRILATLRALQQSHSPERYRPSIYLQRAVADGRALLA